jgi:hypothetical protein
MVDELVPTPSPPHPVQKGAQHERAGQVTQSSLRRLLHLPRVALPATALKLTTPLA